MLTKEFMKQDVSHFLPVSHPSHLGSGKEEKLRYFLFEESSSAFYPKLGNFLHLLPALLLQPELYLEVGVAAHHEEQRGVEAVQVAVIPPRQADHLSVQVNNGRRSTVTESIGLSVKYGHENKQYCDLISKNW